MLFPAGRIHVHRSVLLCDSILVPDLVQAFDLYLQGNWGEIDSFQSLMNDVALASGEAVTGKYKSSAGTEFWIRKEGNTTHVILPKYKETCSLRIAL